MAIPIKQVPILSGKLADEFIRQAEENESKHRTPLSKEAEERIARVMKEMRAQESRWTIK